MKLGGWITVSNSYPGSLYCNKYEEVLFKRTIHVFLFYNNSFVDSCLQVVQGLRELSQQICALQTEILFYVSDLFFIIYIL